MWSRAFSLSPLSGLGGKSHGVEWTNRQALAPGIEHFEVMPGLNDFPRFISALVELFCGVVGLEVATSEMR